MDRFAVLREDDTAALAERAFNGNTKKSTKQWMNVYKSWAKIRGENEIMEEILPVSKLNNVLRRFYAEIRKQNGKEYEPDCLRVMQGALHRYLVERQYPANIINGPEFQDSRNVLEGKARELRAAGMGKKPNARDPLTDVDENALWVAGKLGAIDPKTLQQTVWYLLTLHMGLRAVQEHTTMEVTNFVERVAKNGMTYIEFHEKPTKTRNSGLNPKKRPAQPKMFATGDVRCPVRLFKLYLSKRPPGFQKTGRFYLHPIVDGSHQFRQDWYKTSPMGKNLVSCFMKEIIRGTPIETSNKKISNHSGRKTVVTKLRSAGVPDTSIVKVTGHTTTEGLSSYDRCDEVDFQRMSNAINGGKSVQQNVPLQASLLPRVSEVSSSSSSSTLSRPISNNFPQTYQDYMAVGQNNISNLLNSRSFTPQFSFFPSTSSSQNLTQQQQPIYNNCVFNINTNNNNNSPPRPYKRRRVIISDSDEED